MKKTFVNKEKLEEIVKEFPTPFHLYDEKGIRENVRNLQEAFSWNKGYKEYFAVKATPNPTILQILKEEGCGVDCSSYTELISIFWKSLRGCRKPSVAALIPAAILSSTTPSWIPPRPLNTGSPGNK
jgi:hypothetical protein